MLMNSENWVLKDHFNIMKQSTIIDHILRFKRFGYLYVRTILQYLNKIVS